MKIVEQFSPARSTKLATSALLGTAGKVGMFSLLLLAASQAVAKSEKISVCHVDSETGNINLIVVSPNSNHLGNPAHEFEGLTDFTPQEALASGRGTEDSNGDGIDDGCEPPSEAECPCFSELDLQLVTAENQNSSGSCENNLPLFAQIYDGDGVNVFLADQTGDDSFLPTGGCATRSGGAILTDDELAIEACIDLIALRCAEIAQ